MDVPGGSVAKTLGSQCRGAWVQSLVRALDPMCHNYEFACCTKDLTCHNEDRRPHILQLRPNAAKHKLNKINYKKRSDMRETHGEGEKMRDDSPEGLPLQGSVV